MSEEDHVQLTDLFPWLTDEEAKEFAEKINKAKKILKGHVERNPPPE